MTVFTASDKILVFKGKSGFWKTSIHDCEFDNLYRYLEISGDINNLIFK